MPGRLVSAGFAQVREEDAGPRPVQVAGVVVRAGRGRLLERGHALDLHAPLGPHVEQRADPHVRVIQDLLIVGEDHRAARVAGRVVEARLGLHLLHRRRQIVRLVALFLEQHPHLT
jgi:hypothetical protein